VDGEVNNNANDVLTLVLADVFSGMLVLFGPHGDTQDARSFPLLPAGLSAIFFSLYRYKVLTVRWNAVVLLL
jgi:hypothetical protein